MKILHLSDLHIPQLSNKLNRTGDWDFDSMKKELINDISKEFRKKDDNELAVTEGCKDTKGKYNLCPRKS